ncbi:MAG: TraE/TraK family type IV conjugative transfer system protein [Sulfurihydrogenibium azorense]|uniref:TraE/TraK family type IV conjugative transfer system protein n=1 Tax=Sulfurihydrogenibium azorense TaxID=309806 RepID=UPI00391A30CE
MANKFLNEFREALKEARILKLMVLVLVGLVLLEFFLVGKLVTNQKIVIVPEGLKKKVYIEGDNASVDYVQAFTYAIVSNYYNYTPENVEKNYKYLLSYFEPSLYSSVSSKFLGLARKYKDNNASSFASINKILVYPDKNQVVVDASVRTFIGDVKASVFRSTLTLGYKIDSYSFVITSFNEEIHDNIPVEENENNSSSSNNQGNGG